MTRTAIVHSSLLALSFFLICFVDCEPARAQTGGCFDETRLAGDDLGSLDHFGGVALSENLALVGASGHDGSAVDTGAAYLFREQGTPWIQEAKLVASDAQGWSYFGIAVAVEANVAVVSAPYQTVGTTFAAGAVYVFRFDGSTWVEEQKLVANDPGSGDQFGRGLALAGDSLLVGTMLDDDPILGSNVGSVYVFRRGAGGWVQEAKLTAGDGAANDRFGSAVALSGNVALIGANAHDGNRGAAYFYRFGSSGWVEEQVVAPSSLEPGDYFGIAADLVGGLAAIGAETYGNEGAAFLYRFDGTSWVEEATVTTSDPLTSSRFGHSVSLDGGTLVVGTSIDGHPGQAYVFKRSCTGWDEVFKLEPGDGVAGTSEYFGTSVANDGDRILVGAHMKADAGGAVTGAAYVYDLH